EVSPAAPVETAVTEEAETTAPPSEEPSVQPPANTKQIEHVVKGGDFLSSIATKYKVTYQDLMQWNHLNDTKLNVGQVLIVHVPQDFQDSESATATPTDGTPAPPAEEEPQAEASAPVETSETATPPADTEVTYSVKRGDNLANIASKYGVTVQDLREWNGIEGNRIDVDQKLKIRPNKLPAE
ncbi:MAG TPA: LysM peptidoglycan-binding domain-containing protein, partial [Candidatus Hydrogenedentes bacterium]|nr:LysM peptidoglycan-binding domain-containing protein [Candidatus Hydrogenedentota bacterium]